MPFRPLLALVALLAGPASDGLAQNPPSTSTPPGCSSLTIYRLQPGRTYTNACATVAYVLPASFYEQVIRDYNAVPALRQAIAARDSLIRLWTQKFDALDSTHAAVVGLSRQLHRAGGDAIDDAIHTLDADREALRRAGADLREARAAVQDALEALQRRRTRSRLTAAALFGGGVVAGFLLAR